MTKCSKVWLVPRPVAIGDDGTEVLISKLEVVIDQVLGVFKGNIKVFGPSPRHIGPCCNNKEHLVMEENGNQVDMEVFVRGFNKFLLGAKKRCRGEG